MDYIKTMGNYCKYGVATEGVCTTAVVAATALIGAAIAKAAIKHKVDESRKKKYDKEYATGNVSDKTYAKASNVKVHGVPYPQYLEKKLEVKKNYADPAFQIITDTQKAIKDQITKFCNSNDQYKPLLKIKTLNFLDIHKDDVVEAILNYNDGDVDFLYALSIEAIKFELENMDSDDFDTVRNLTSDENINAMKTMGMTMLSNGLKKIYSIINAELKKAVSKLKSLKIPGEISSFSDGNPDDVSLLFGIKFKCKLF